MRPDRIDIPTMLARLTPKKRVEAEDLVFELAIRRDRARRPAVHPIVREHSKACVAAIFGDPPMPLSREAEEALRTSWREMGRYILDREMEEARPSPALVPKDDGADV